MTAPSPYCIKIVKLWHKEGVSKFVNFALVELISKAINITYKIEFLVQTALTLLTFIILIRASLDLSSCCSCSFDCTPLNFLFLGLSRVPPITLPGLWNTPGPREPCSVLLLCSRRGDTVSVDRRPIISTYRNIEIQRNLLYREPKGLVKMAVMYR